MSTTIDQKVVEMKFDNAQFERGVQQTVNSIDGLKKSLDFTGVEKNVSTIGKALGNLPLDSIANSVSALEDRFSAFGIAGMVIIERLTNACINFVSKGLGGIIRTITSKGLTRAFNIENAHFLLQGLLSDENEVQAIMSVANESVLDTAYGYDEAAKAAAAFVASGLKAEQLIQPLRAIAGTAASFNADYSRVADLFTNISGQGRVMTQNLYSFSAMGMNYPAILAKYLQGFGDVKDLVNVYPEVVKGIANNKKVLEEFNATGKITESVVREMVTAGVVDFQLFSDSLDSTFGEHAKKANETFNGAMSNVRAALGRVGAKFISPLIEQKSAVVGLINAVRVKINEFNKATNAISSVFTKRVLEIAGSLRDWLNSFSLISKFSLISAGIVQEFNILNKVLEAAGSNLKNIFAPLVNGYKKNVEPITKRSLKDMFLLQKYFVWLSEREMNVIRLSDGMGKRLTDAFTKFFGAIKNVKDAFHDFIYSFTAAGFSDGVYDNLKDTFNGLAAVVDIFVRLITAAIKILPSLGHYVLVIFRTIVSITGFIGRLIMKIDEWLSQSVLVKRAMEFITNVLGNFRENIDLAISTLGNFYEAVSNRVSDITSKLSPFKSFIDGLGRIVVEVFSIISNAVTSTFKSISETFNANGGYNSLLDFLNILLGSSTAFLMLNDDDDFFGIKSFLDNISESFKGVIKDLNIKGIIEAVTELTDSLEDKFKYEALKQMAIAIAILAASLLILASIDPAKLATAIAAVSALFFDLTLTMKSISKIDMKGRTALSSVGSMIAVSSALLILALAVRAIANVNPENLVGAVLAISVLLWELVLVIKFIASEIKPRKIKKTMAGIGQLILFAAAVYILAMALRKIAELDYGSQIVALMSVVTLVGMMAVVINMTAQIPKDAGKASVSLIGFAASVYILCLALKKVADLDPDKLVNAMVSVGALMLALVIAVSIMSSPELKDGKTKGAVAMIAFAGSMLILAGIVQKLSAMDTEQLGRGLGGLLGCVIMLVIASKMMAEVSAKDSASLILVATSLLILAGVIKILGGMDVIQLGKALITLASAFVILGVAASYLSKFDTALLKIAKSMLIFGAAVFAVGAGIAALGAGLTMIAASGVAAMGALVLAIEALIVGLIEVIDRSLTSILRTIKNLVLGIIDVLVECIPALVDGLLKLVDELLRSLVDYIPTILDSLVEIFIKLLDGLAAWIPDLLVKLFAVIDLIVEGVAKKLKSIDFSFTDLLLGLAGMAALMIGLSYLSHLMVPALKGVLAFGVVLTALIGVIALIGGLNELLPGLKGFVESGGDLLLALGTAIGKFFGGIIGGIAEGITNSLPRMAEDFSSFMENLKPFIEGAKDITPESMEGVSYLAKALLALTAANLLDQIAAFFGAKTSLADFGMQLAEFAPYFKTYADSIDGIDEEAVTSSANAARALAELAKELPNCGGLVSIFTGDNKMDKFGERLSKFGTSFAEYAESVDGIDSAAVEESTTLAGSLSALAKDLPNTGGLVEFFTGGNDIDKFGSALVGFGNCMVAYSDRVVNIDSDAVGRSIEDFSALLDLVHNIEGTDSSELMAFSTGIANLGHTAVNDFIGCFTGAYIDVETAVNGMMDTAYGAVERGMPEITRFMGTLAIVMTQALNDGTKWKDAGSTIIFDLLAGMKTKTAKSKSEVGTIIRGMINEIRSRRPEFEEAGQYLMDGLIYGVGLKTVAVKQAAKNMANNAINTLNATLGVQSPSKVAKQTGKYFVEGFVNGMLGNINEVLASSTEVGSVAMNGLNRICSEVSDLVANGIDANPTIRPVLDLSDVESKSRQLNNLIGTDQALAIGSGAKGTAAMMLNMSKAQTNGIQNGPIITIQNMNVDGAENPEEWAHQFVSSLYRQVRMGVV